MRRAWGVVWASVVMAAATEARAGNDDSFFQGNDAAMLGGAVAAVGEGPDMIWYNPAGLAGNTRSRIELSGSAFSYRLRNLDPYLAVSYPDGTADSAGLRSREFQSVPSALSLARSVGDGVTIGFGVFVPAQDTFATSRALSVSRDEGSLELATSASFQHQRMHAGPSIGFRVGALRLGVSLFGVYERVALQERPTLQVETPEVRVAATEELRFELSRLALELVLGAQLELPRGVRLAAVVRGPRIRISDSVDYEVLAFGAFEEGGDADFFFSRLRDRFALRDRRAVLAAPIEVLFGVGWRSERARVGADARFSHAYEGLLESAFQYNFRVGGAVRVTPNVEIGGGVFTDRAHYTEAFSALAVLDYYGASFGITLDTPVDLLSRREGARPEPLVLRLTLAVRYAAGIGAGYGTAVDFGADDDQLFRPTAPVDVVFHELGAYVGSGIDF
ncbi:MAG: hypothetical protein KF901_20895 [Myxococcales bacterium]|nr:hypothetical protein [Myxococcales bacterium]